MAITLCIDTKTKKYNEYPSALLDIEVIDYLCNLESFPSRSCDLIRDLDPYGTKRLSGGAVSFLLEDFVQIRETAKARQLPPPPDYVDIEYNDGEQFGWDGFLEFLNGMIEFLSYAKQGKLPVVCFGD